MMDALDRLRRSVSNKEGHSSKKSSRIRRFVGRQGYFSLCNFLLCIEVTPVTSRPSPRFQG